MPFSGSGFEDTTSLVWTGNDSIKIHRDTTRAWRAFWSQSQRKRIEIETSHNISKTKSRSTHQLQACDVRHRKAGLLSPAGPAAPIRRGEDTWWNASNGPKGPKPDLEAPAELGKGGHVGVLHAWALHQAVVAVAPRHRWRAGSERARGGEGGGGYYYECQHPVRTGGGAAARRYTCAQLVHRPADGKNIFHEGRFAGVPPAAGYQDSVLAAQALFCLPGADLRTNPGQTPLTLKSASRAALSKLTLLMMLFHNISRSALSTALGAKSIFTGIFWYP